MPRTGEKKTFAKKAVERLDNVYISESGVKSALYRVRRELKDFGLLFTNSRLSKVKVIHEGATFNGLASFMGIMGFYDPQGKDIHIPAIWPAALLPWYKERCMADVLRHEFGHALEGKFPKFFHDRRFKKAFGDEYGETKVSENDEEWNYVSNYARKNTQEDFAETFMLFLKYTGVLPTKFSQQKAILVKWKTVAAICRAIANLKK